MKHYRILQAACTLSAALLLSTACTKDDAVADENALPEGKYPLQISTITMDVEAGEAQPWGAPQTRVSENEDGTSSQWTNGDQIGVQIGNDTDTETGIYTVNVDGSGNVTSLTATTPVYWKSTTRQTIYAWYPATEGTVTLSDQSKGLAYVLKGTGQGTYNDAAVNLTFTHQLAKVRVTLTGAKAGAINKVEIKGYPTCTNDKGTVTTDGSRQDWITMHYDGSDVWEANVVPVSTVDGTNLIRLNGTTTATIDGITGFVAGKMCKIGLTIYQAGSFVVSTGLASTATYTYNGLQMQIGTEESTTPLSTVTISGGKAYFPPTTLQSLKAGSKIWFCIPRVVKFFHTLTQAEVDAKALTLPDKDGGSTLLKDGDTYKAGDNYYKNNWIVALYMGINKYNGTTPTETPLYWATGNLIATKTNAAKEGEVADYETATAFHIATVDETAKESTATQTTTPYDVTPTVSATDGYAACALGSQWNMFGWGDDTGLKTSLDDGDYASSITTSISGTSYDIARAQLGGSWYMPDDNELNEMIGLLKVSNVWNRGRKGTYACECTTVNSQSITITNTLSFPAAGYRGGDKVEGRVFFGVYWSGSACGLSDAYYLYFSYDGKVVSRGSNYRYFGQSVRPVSE